MFPRGWGRGFKISNQAYGQVFASRSRPHGPQFNFQNADQVRPLARSRCLSTMSAKNNKDDVLGRYKESYLLTPLSESTSLLDSRLNELHLGKTISVYGFLGKRKDLSESLSFVDLFVPESDIRTRIQVVSRGGGNQVPTSETVHQKLRGLRTHSAVFISGKLGLKPQPKGTSGATDASKRFIAGNLEVILEDITCLAAFPEDIIVSNGVQFLPERRHLQLRFDDALKRRLSFRDRVLRECRLALEDFLEIETPILFKSTPEGAREFLVPTRRPGYAYALPQSPQQYKQILMASGIHRYFQIAKCFRDEDLRADRQPEFTQVDFEMAFSDGETVMGRIETFINVLLSKLQEAGAVVLPPASPIPRISYREAMLKHGSDKPDLRIKGLIHQVDHMLPEDLIHMLTSLSDPVVDAWKIHLECDPSGVRNFVKQFMNSAEAASFQESPDGPPGIFVYDPRKPLEGLQAFGYEGLNAIKEMFADLESTGKPALLADTELSEAAAGAFEEGDLIIMQARPRARFSGGSTAMGRLRSAIHSAAVSKGLTKQDKMGHWLWVIDFPLFTPSNDADPGQGGSAGFSATHHPFTAPRTASDVDLLVTDPLAATADHYDLVFNGIELGGGSRRIHDSEMQQFLMRDVLKMSEERLKDFSHLFEVLRAGCPPHAGIALGLDRLIAVMLGVDSVRDVIAFPKSGRGEDLLVKSPSLMTKEQQKTYHIKVFE